jgi:hypothetical protein
MIECIVATETKFLAFHLFSRTFRTDFDAGLSDQYTTAAAEGL